MAYMYVTDNCSVTTSNDNAVDFYPPHNRTFRAKLDDIIIIILFRYKKKTN